MKQGIKYVLLGIILALSYLTRSEGIFLLFIFSLFTLRNIKQLGIMLLSFFISAFPYFYLNYLIHGNPLYSYVVNHFRVHQFSEGMESGFEKQFPSVNYFIFHNTQSIIHQVFSSFLDNLKSIISIGFLGAMTLLTPFALKNKSIITFAPFWLLSLLIIINYSLFWSAFSEPERHLALAFILLLIPLLYSVQQFKKNGK